MGCRHSALRHDLVAFVALRGSRNLLSGAGLLLALSSVGHHPHLTGRPGARWPRSDAALPDGRHRDHRAGRAAGAAARAPTLAAPAWMLLLGLAHGSSLALALTLIVVARPTPIMPRSSRAWRRASATWWPAPDRSASVWRVSSRAAGSCPDDAHRPDAASVPAGHGRLEGCPCRQRPGAPGIVIVLTRAQHARRRLTRVPTTSREPAASLRVRTR